MFTIQNAIPRTQLITRPNMIKNLKIRAISYNCEDLTCRIFCLILITECYEHQKNLVCPQMLAVYIMEPKIC